MKCYRHWTVWEWIALLIVVTVCGICIMGTLYAIYGPDVPKKPLSPKETFVESCRGASYKNVANVGSEDSSKWTCEEAK